ncbi:hypothetical protein AALO_G00241250 [Alosa alosa]|uniref:Uncharacterized protein n=1 Tax=Alosa alosa TaxID=278164 RepID=A0AAV6FRM1_9TELE|nr:hypothetical protein AALO_G00241250 [Alosa alosa]
MKNYSKCPFNAVMELQLHVTSHVWALNSIDIIYIDAALAAGNKKCGRHLGPVILLIALQQKTQDDSTVQHVPAQIGGPYWGFTFHKCANPSEELEAAGFGTALSDANTGPDTLSSLSGP